MVIQNEGEEVEVEGEQGGSLWQMPLAMCVKAKPIKPLVIFEVKRMNLQQLENLKELFLQAYYSPTYYCMEDCVYCLTDGIFYDYSRVVCKDF